MGMNECEGLPGDLRRAQSRFQAWRSQRVGGSRIPEELWKLASRLARRYGVSRTASALRLDYYGLKKRAEAVPDACPSHHPAFIELPPPILTGKQCFVELDHGAGAALRLQLVGYDMADLEVLVRHFGNAG